MSLSYSQLPFGNLHKRAAFKSTTALAPISATNIITSPAGATADNASASSAKTPLDMGVPAQSPADQSPTEQALGASADQLKLQDDHAKLQAEHQKLQQQTDTMKQQALIAKQQASLKAAPAGPKAPSLEKYKSMSMQLMGRHMDRITQNLKGLSDGAGGLPMQMKLACAFRALDLFEKASDLPASSMSPKLLADAGSGTKNLGAGTGNIAETSDQAQRLSRLTAGPAPGGWIDQMRAGSAGLLHGVNHYFTGPQHNRFDDIADSATGATANALPTALHTAGAAAGSMVGNEESQKDMNALTSTVTTGKDTALGAAQQIAATPDSTRAAPLNLNALRKLGPVERAQALAGYQKSLTYPSNSSSPTRRGSVPLLTPTRRILRLRRRSRSWARANATRTPLP